MVLLGSTTYFYARPKNYTGKRSCLAHLHRVLLNGTKGVGTEVCLVETHTCIEVLGSLNSHAVLHLFGYT